MKPLERFHPETRVGGYTNVDGTVEFYQRLHTLLRPNQEILDLGAGRGAWANDDAIAPIHRKLHDLRGDGRRVIGCDVDPVVLKNSTLDEAHVLPSSSAPFPYADSRFDVVVSDWTFEHLPDPSVTSSEIARVLKPGGWLCARTPNKNGYISLGNRVVPEAAHRLVLGRGQPERKTEDIFPALYRLNTRDQIAKCFGEAFIVTTYITNPEPAYVGQSNVGWAAWKFVERFLPGRFGAVLLIFAQRV